MHNNEEGTPSNAMENNQLNQPALDLFPPERLFPEFESRKEVRVSQVSRSCAKMVKAG